MHVVRLEGPRIKYQRVAFHNPGCVPILKCKTRGGSCLAVAVRIGCRRSVEIIRAVPRHLLSNSGVTCVGKGALLGVGNGHSFDNLWCRACTVLGSSRPYLGSYA